MPGPWDASIKLLYPVDQGTFSTLDDIDNNTPFDVIANVEIGENLNENPHEHEPEPDHRWAKLSELKFD